MRKIMSLFVLTMFLVSLMPVALAEEDTELTPTATKVRNQDKKEVRVIAVQEKKVEDMSRWDVCRKLSRARGPAKRNCEVCRGAPAIQKRFYQEGLHSAHQESQEIKAGMPQESMALPQDFNSFSLSPFLVFSQLSWPLF